MNQESQPTPKGQGSTETAYRQWIRTLGRLSPEQEARAETIYVLAASLDKSRSTSRGDSSTAANARAITVLTREFREMSGIVIVKDTPEREDSVDEVSAKRNERLAEQRGRQTK